MQQEIIEGTWKEVAKRAADISPEARVRLEVLGGQGGKMITRGMFPQLKGLSEEDFESAEWRGPTEGQL
jgi:hypothetical protein